MQYTVGGRHWAYVRATVRFVLSVGPKISLWWKLYMADTEPTSEPQYVSYSTWAPKYLHDENCKNCLRAPKYKIQIKTLYKWASHETKFFFLHLERDLKVNSFSLRGFKYIEVKSDFVSYEISGGLNKFQFIVGKGGYKFKGLKRGWESFITFSVSPQPC